MQEQRHRQHHDYSPRREDDWYEEDDFGRDPYRDDRYDEDAYHKRGRNGQSGRKYEKMISNTSGNSNPYYYTDQIPSTTVGVKTLPEISRYDSVSDASIPVQSIRSQKEIPRHHYEQLSQKKSLKLDRPKLNKQKEKKKQKEHKNPYNPYE